MKSIYPKSFAAGIALSVMAMHAESRANAVEKPTFTKDVAPILYDNCVACHSPNQGAPMSLRTYEEVRPWAKSISKNVQDRSMPPWHANPDHGHFKNDRSLSQNEIDTIARWVEQGTTRGAKADMPPLPPVNDSGWQLGEPDMILQYEEVSLAGGGPDIFRDLVVPTDLDEDRWLTAVEILPSNKSIAHHVILYQQEKGSMGPSPNGWLGAWAAGTDPMKFPEKTGRMLKKGASIVADMHYHPAETPQSDTLSIGLHFGEEGAIEKELVNLWITNQTIDLPPGAKNVEVASSFTFRQDAQILGLIPHMHYRGRDFTYTATYPDGSDEILLQVENYNFAWQTNYSLAEPKPMPAGTRIDCVAHYDNSADNPYNPDPTAYVQNGDESFDEMMIGFVDYIVDDGIRPRDATEIVAEILDGLMAKHNAGVYKTTIMGQFPGALHLTPGATSVVWQLAMLGDLRDAAIENLVWNGNEFTGNGSIDGFGDFSIEGTIDTEKDRIRGKIGLGDDMAFFGGQRPK